MYEIQSSLEDLTHDANCIISLLETTGSKFTRVVENLESCDINTISQWVAEAINLIYTAKGPPNSDKRNDDTSAKTLGASDEACMATAVIVQWLVRYMCKKLIQLKTPEAVILKRK